MTLLQDQSESACLFGSAHIQRLGKTRKHVYGRPDTDGLRSTGQSTQHSGKGSVSYLDFWKYLDAIDVAHFKKDLKDLKKFIFQVMETPLSERGMPPFM